MICMTLDCVKLLQSSAIQTIHHNVGLKCFFSILPKCFFVYLVIYAYFIYISHGVVGYIIITLLQIVRRVC